MAPTAVDSKRISDITEDGSMDRRGNPAVKAKTGNWRSSILLLGKAMFYFNSVIHISTN
jgi:peptide/histidine transporter 3/4